MKKELEDIIAKLKAKNRKKIQESEDSAELLLKSEGYAISQSQSYKVDFKLISDIRLGIKECRKLTATYNDKERSLIPLGLIYGEKVFLVAKEDGKGDKIYQYALHKFKDLKVSYNNFKSQEFNLKEYGYDSFVKINDDVVEIDFQKYHKIDVSDDDIQPEFTIDESIFEDAENILFNYLYEESEDIIWKELSRVY